MQFPIRINKYLAEKGITTRRGADELIKNGTVFINGGKAIIGQMVHEGDNVVIASDKKDVVKHPMHTYIAYHKLAGEATFGVNEESMLTRLEKTYQVTNMAPVGRLEKAYAGLILLTNDGRVTRRLFSPDASFEREYLVEVDKRISDNMLAQLEKGMRIEREKTKPARTRKITSTTFTLIITEGKKHQIKRMLAALGFQIKKIVRVRVATVSLGTMKPGQYRILRGKELKTFLDTLAIKSL